MAEYKNYIKQELEKGSLMISENVITTIVSNAIREIDGVVELITKPGSDIADILGKKSWGKGVKLNVDEAGETTIECNVNIGYGQSIVEMAKAVQTAVENALAATTGIQCAKVNVNICGIIHQ